MGFRGEGLIYSPPRSTQQERNFGQNQLTREWHLQSRALEYEHFNVSSKISSTLPSVLSPQCAQNSEEETFPVFKKTYQQRQHYILERSHSHK